jgi:hypothetical protein
MVPAKTHNLLSFPRERRTLFLCYFWFGCTVLFACLALVAAQGTSTKLPRAGFRISVRADARGKFRTEEIVNDLAERHDRTVAVLEEFIHKTARTNVLLNLVAVGLSLCALSTQLVSMLAVRRDLPDAFLPAAAPRRRRLRVAPPETETPELAVHDGSFPDSGYAR